MACERHLASFSGQCIAIELRAVAVSARLLQRVLRVSVLGVPNQRRAQTVSQAQASASANRSAFARHPFVGQRAAVGRSALPFVLPNPPVERTAASGRPLTLHVGRHDHPVFTLGELEL